jgi:hypothetical protein
MCINKKYDQIEVELIRGALESYSNTNFSILVTFVCEPSRWPVAEEAEKT